MPTRNSDDFVKPNPRIPKPLAEELRRVAEAERRSLNDQIIIAIETFLRERQRAGDKQ